MQDKNKSQSKQQQNGRQHTSELTTIVKLCAAHKVVPALSSTVFLRRTRLSPRRLLKIAFVPKYQVVVDRCNVNWRPPSSWTTFSVPAGLAVTLLPRLGPSNNACFAKQLECNRMMLAEVIVKLCPRRSAVCATFAASQATLHVIRLRVRWLLFRRQSHLLLSKRKP